MDIRGDGGQAGDAQLYRPARPRARCSRQPLHRRFGQSRGPKNRPRRNHFDGCRRWLPRLLRRRRTRDPRTARHAGRRGHRFQGKLVHRGNPEPPNPQGQSSGRHLHCRRQRAVSTVGHGTGRLPDSPAMAALQLTPQLSLPEGVAVDSHMATSLSPTPATTGSGGWTFSGVIRTIGGTGKNVRTPGNGGPAVLSQSLRAGRDRHGA